MMVIPDLVPLHVGDGSGGQLDVPDSSIPFVQITMHHTVVHLKRMVRYLAGVQMLMDSQLHLVR